MDTLILRSGNSMGTYLLMFMLSFVVHELAHACTALSLGVRVRRFGLSWKGLYLVREAGPPRLNLVVTLAGPLANLLLACTWPAAPRFAMINLIFGLTNLLPLEESDGRRAWMLLRRRDLLQSPQ